MTFQFKHHLGFTLIELLITSAIVALIIGGGIAAFSSFTDRQEVLNTAKELQQMMRTAQSKARVRDVPSSGCATLTSYEVWINPSTTAYLIAKCASPSTNVVLKTYTLPTGVTLTSSPSNWNGSLPRTLRFSTLENGLYDNQTPSAVITTSTEYTISRGSYSYRFTVSPSGAISNVAP